MELHCRYSLLLVLVGLLSGVVVGSEVNLRRLRREIIQIESMLGDDSKPDNAEFGLRALKYEKDFKYEKSAKSDKKTKIYETKSDKADKADKAAKYEKEAKTYKKDKYEKKDKDAKYEKKGKDAKYEKHSVTTRQVDIGGGVMMSMPLDVVMIDMSMSMSM